ncbi:unnamed protein product [Paramecium sonneborni]|uniref:Uncharacterized protein n=1 Tax=Paramecium sonneborni TaxID=65129 RepID=A0A8S1LGC4_9CILI|nr:unnamed protein product [Paramecium sonneborni]
MIPSRDKFYYYFIYQFGENSKRATQLFEQLINGQLKIKKQLLLKIYAYNVEIVRICQCK